MRIGIFGGTFDPPHYGHLILAEQAREQAGLDAVWFVPAGQPPHKEGAKVSPFERRTEMVKLAVAGAALFSVSAVEGDRPGMSYTADTLDAIAADRPGDELFLLIGGDSLADLPRWREPRRIVERAGLVVMARPRFPVPTAAAVRESLDLPAGMALRYLPVDVPLIDLASADIRRRVAQGRSVRFMLPRAVEVYVAEKGLYRS